MTLLPRGFLAPKDPLKKLPKAFKEWELTAVHLPKLLLGDGFKQQIQSLPAFPLKALNTEPEYERAMLILSFLGHAYVWGQKHCQDRLPQVLAKPWCAIAEHLGRPPVLSYASYALNNWYRLDPSKAIALGNIALVQNFLGGMDEEWFVLVHIDIEAKASQAIRALIPAQKAAAKKDQRSLLACLNTIEESLENICNSLDRMPEHCDPYVYYTRVRPYIHGWKNNPALPKGLLYEHCFNEERQFFCGETGAQSSIIPALGAVLGIEHQEDFLSIYLKEMRSYMPFAHQHFLAELDRQASIRAYVSELKQTNPPLVKTYNRCIDYMIRFRMTHLKYAAVYIHQQNKQSLANPTNLGTGGTPFMQYLAKHEKETEGYKIF